MGVVAVEPRNRDKFTSIGQGVKTDVPHPLVFRLLHPASAPTSVPDSSSWKKVTHETPEAGVQRELIVTKRIRLCVSVAIPVTFKPYRSPGIWRERSFYQGLNGPSLCLALQGGIAYAWGLRTFKFGTREFADAHP